MRKFIWKEIEITYHHLLPLPLPRGIRAVDWGTIDPTRIKNAKPMITKKTETVGVTAMFLGVPPKQTKHMKFIFFSLSCQLQIGQIW